MAKKKKKKTEKPKGPRKVRDLTEAENDRLGKLHAQAMVQQVVFEKAQQRANAYAAELEAEVEGGRLQVTNQEGPTFALYKN